MRRALFAREFRSALVPNLITVGAILATLVVVERLFGQRLGKAADVRDFIDIALLLGLIVSGFISGERCFPSELKESRILFLSSLPISRTSVWLMIISSRLIVGIISLALVVAVRRPLPAFQDSGHLLRLDAGLIAALPVLGYVLFFSAGGLFALVFRRTFFSYLVGLLVLAILLAETIFSCSYITSPPSSLGLLAEIPSPNPHPFVSALITILSLSLLLLSLRFFVQGQIADLKQRVINQAICGLTAATYLGVVFGLMSSPKLAAIGISTSRPASWGAGVSAGVSSEGRYLFTFDPLENRPFLAQVSIMDTLTGRIVGQSVYGGIKWGFWSGHGDVLNLLAFNNSPLNRWGYLIPGTLDWIRLSPDAREVSKLRLRGVEEEGTLGGRAVVVVRESGQGRILLLDGTSGQFSEVARAYLDGQVTIRGDGEEALVYFDNILQSKKAWIIDSLAREVQVPRPSRQRLDVIYGQAVNSIDEIQARLARTFGTPLTQGGAPVQGKFVVPAFDETRLSTSGSGIKYIYFKDGTSALWARATRPEGRWERVPFPATSFANVDFATGIGIFRSLQHRSFFVFDPRRRLSFEKEDACAPNTTYAVNTARVPGLKGLLIALICMERHQRPMNGRIRYFEFLPDPGEVRMIKTASGRYFPGPDQLYFDEQGVEVWATSGSLGSKEIWRSAPGTKDLRLWPISAASGK